MQKKKFKLPHVYILLMMVMLLVVLLSWIVPSGEFAMIQDPTSGRMVIDPQNFNYIENKDPIGVLDFFTAIHNGIVQSGDIIISLLLISGALYLIESTGSIGAGIHKILEISKGKELLVMAMLTLIFSILGAIGFAEGGLPFIPLSVSVVMALGYDRIAGMATAVLGLSAGFTSGVLNLYTTGVGQSIVGLPLYSGIGFRLFSLLIFYLLVTGYILLYCKKIKADPMKSVVSQEYANSNKNKEVTEEKISFTIARKLTLITLAFIFVFQAYGSIKLGWGLPQIAGIYILLTLFVGILHKVNPDTVCTTFATGCANMLPAGLTIGLARSVMILMSQAKIIDPVIHSLAKLLNGKSPLMIIFIVYVAVILFNFFVTSGSGKAVILMPILGPLAQLTGLNQQVMVITYQFGDGFTNYLWPTSGTLMCALSMCQVEWSDWVRFSGKIFAVLITVGFLLAGLAQLIGLGPF